MLQKTTTISHRLTGPLLDDCIRDISHQDVDMFQARHALQRAPVLKPEHPLPRPIPRQSPHKHPLNKGIDDLPRLRRHETAIWLRRDPRLGPYDQVRDFRAEGPVGPIVAQDPIIARMPERGWVLDREDGAGCGAGAGEREPVEALGAHVGRYGAVECDDGFAPGFVDGALRGLAVDQGEAVASCLGRYWGIGDVEIGRWGLGNALGMVGLAHTDDLLDVFPREDFRMLREGDVSRFGFGGGGLGLRPRWHLR